MTRTHVVIQVWRDQRFPTTWCRPRTTGTAPTRRSPPHGPAAAPRCCAAGCCGSPRAWSVIRSGRRRRAGRLPPGWNCSRSPATCPTHSLLQRPHRWNCSTSSPGPRPAACDNRSADQKSRGATGRPRRPPPDWVLEHSGKHKTPMYVHAGPCNTRLRTGQTITAQEARPLITSGVRACVLCRPDTELGTIG
ncbi:DUF6233 domain-containing protein [Streptomyces sp. NPDC008141]|uniref:DUF6233 domain-containing protein n=1 Tax=Streptomyces sp. NPDC008141 TaxID=3364815 RepID=UPI0036E3F682